MVKRWTGRGAGSTKHHACDRHPTRIGVCTCTRCGHNICEGCRLSAASKTYCVPCAMRVAGVKYRSA